MAVVKRAVDVVAAVSPRVGLVLKADIRPGRTGRSPPRSSGSSGPWTRDVRAAAVRADTRAAAAALGPPPRRVLRPAAGFAPPPYRPARLRRTAALPPAPPKREPQAAVLAVVAALVVVAAPSWCRSCSSDDEDAHGAARPRRAPATGRRPSRDADRRGRSPRTTTTTRAVDYDESPPVGGAHYPTWLDCGVYDEPVPDENAVHDLEHGTVWFTYDPTGLDDDEVAALADLLPQNGILSPYDGLPRPSSSRSGSASSRSPAPTTRGCAVPRRVRRRRHGPRAAGLVCRRADGRHLRAGRGAAGLGHRGRPDGLRDADLPHRRPRAGARPDRRRSRLRVRGLAATACSTSSCRTRPPGSRCWRPAPGRDDDLLAALRDLLPADDRWRHRHGSPGHGRSHVMPALVPPYATLPGARRPPRPRHLAEPLPRRPERRQPRCVRCGSASSSVKASP